MHLARVSSFETMCLSSLVSHISQLDLSGFAMEIFVFLLVVPLLARFARFTTSHFLIHGAYNFYLGDILPLPLV